MSYPGNPQLSAEIRQRILDTYRQTLDLASRGNRQEASLGCDFVLRLDPQFEPIRTLMRRLETGDGPVEVDDLRLGAVPSAAPAEPAAEDDIEDLFGETSGAAPELAADPFLEPRAEGSGELRTEFARLLAERRFAELLSRAQEETGAMAEDPELGRLAELAQARLEAEPYVQSFLDSARRELRSGEREKALKRVDSARQLDPEHPQLADLETLLGTASAAPPEPAGAPPQAPASAAGDLAAKAPPRVSMESDGDSRIEELLGEGQAAFEEADYQSAIDAWSRIFLIDIDHQEAARRIEEARRLKAEHERQVEEIFHEAVASLEAGDSAKAEQLFDKVLELQPNHPAAREQRQRLAAGEPAASVAGAATLAAPPMTPPPRAESEAAAPGPARAAAAVSSAVRAPSGRGWPGRSFLLVGGAVLVVVLGLGWLLVQQWDRFFPNAGDETPAVEEGDVVARAVSLHEQGRTRQALNVLRRLPPAHPRYREAQALIDQWQAEETPEAAEEAEPGEAAEEEAVDERLLARREGLVAAARTALAAREHLQAENSLLEAADIAPLEGEEPQILAAAQEALAPLRLQVELMRGGDWEFVLPDLWRLREAQPGNRDVTRLLVNAYHNLGVRDLQRGDALGAVAHFEEAQALDSGDVEIQRHLLFARSYAERNKDLLYQIYVKYIPFR